MLRRDRSGLTFLSGKDALIEANSLYAFRSEINGAPPPVLETSDSEQKAADPVCPPTSTGRPVTSREASLSITDAQLSPAQRKRYDYFSGSLID